MTKLTKKEYDKLLATPPNPLWIFVGYFISLLIVTLITLGLIWLIILIIEAIF